MRDSSAPANHTIGDRRGGGRQIVAIDARELRVMGMHRARLLTRVGPMSSLSTNLIDEIQQHTGEPDRLEAERIALHVLRAVRPMLRVDERRVLAAHLPPSLARALAGASVEIDDSVEQFYRRVAVDSNVPLPRAREQGRIVCALLAQRLSPDERASLVRDMPPEIAVLFTTPPGGALDRGSHEEARPSPPRTAGVTGHTLSTGRPGSRHPLSEARLDRTQSHSVAREPNPHGDSKLSSAEGLTQEQLHESLANGHPRVR
jgi:uncharacterized protein (DUF2267 family)